MRKHLTAFLLALCSVITFKLAAQSNHTESIATNEILNETIGTTVNMNILNPNSTIFASWTHNCTATGKASYWGYSKKPPTISRTYTFEANYNGITCSQSFNINNPTSISELYALNKLHIYPNPFNTDASIHLDNPINNGELSVYNVYGQQVKSIKNISVQNIELQRGSLSDGLYFIIITQNERIIAEEKLVITD